MIRIWAVILIGDVIPWDLELSRNLVDGEGESLPGTEMLDGDRGNTRGGAIRPVTEPLGGVMGDIDQIGLAEDVLKLLFRLATAREV